MRKKRKLPFFFILAVLLFLMSRSKSSTDQLRGIAIASVAPLWHWASTEKVEDGPFLKLQIENQLLKNEVARTQELLKEAFYLKTELRQLFLSNNIVQNHLNDLQYLMKKRLEAIPARVIYRASSSWNSYLWIDVGRATNEALKRTVIEKNSPVVVGNSLVGVIDYVGKKQARVRLITDAKLYPAVRAVRGSPQGIRLIETINVLLDNLAEYDSLFTLPQERETFFQQLQKVQEALAKNRETLYLAKGELQGCSTPQQRSHGNLLKGIGFNCDFADEKGPARDLRSGIPYGNDQDGQPIPLLKIHDILATSGMDGIFPEGLQVAEIVSIDPLEEGGYFYELQAKPTAGNLDALSLVFVMAPQGFDPEDSL
ncbi:MAG: rod shape-determining protein MreC [Parachlamydiaceae bacterium]|nr:rod shape-determining protein MreC [Parachlamydiaceae bacterium]